MSEAKRWKFHSSDTGYWREAERIEADYPKHPMADIYVHAQDYDRLLALNAEMLEALKEAKENIVHPSYLGDGTWAMLDAAIAKATPTHQPPSEPLP